MDGPVALVAADLASTDILRGASDAALALVTGSCQPISIAVGHVLLSPERENVHVYVLLSGTLGLHFSSATAPEVRELLPGTSVGEMSVIEATRPSAYVVAKTPARVLPLHRDVVLGLIGREPIVASNLLILMTRWIRLNTERIILDQQVIWELSGHANLDPLTGLYNRRWLDNALRRLLEQSRKGGRPVALTALLIDVDGFKSYNDAHGHLGGDRALMVLADRLKTILRPFDFSARFGGDEFLVVLPNTDADEGLAVAERLRRGVEEEPVSLPDGTQLPRITISIGLAANVSAGSLDALIAAAAASLYRAKREGRNRVATAT